MSVRLVRIEYSDEVAAKICEAVATTPRGLDFLCATRKGFPGISSVMRWLVQYPEFRQAYTVAKEQQADLLAYEGLEIADDSSGDSRQIERRDGTVEVIEDREFTSRSKLRCEQRRWMAGKLAPHKYGERLDLNATLGAISHEDALAQLR
jgi:hypothetical protein